MSKEEEKQRCQTFQTEGKLCDAHAAGHTGTDCGWIAGEKNPPAPAPAGCDYPAEYFMDEMNRMF